MTVLNYKELSYSDLLENLGSERRYSVDFLSTLKVDIQGFKHYELDEDRLISLRDRYSDLDFVPEIFIKEWQVYSNSPPEMLFLFPLAQKAFPCVLNRPDLRYLLNITAEQLKQVFHLSDKANDDGSYYLTGSGYVDEGRKNLVKLLGKTVTFCPFIEGETIEFHDYLPLITAKMDVNGIFRRYEL